MAFGGSGFATNALADDDLRIAAAGGVAVVVLLLASCLIAGAPFSSGTY